MEYDLGPLSDEIKIGKPKTDSIKIKINFDNLINEIIERNGSIPKEIEKVFRDLDKEFKGNYD